MTGDKRLRFPSSRLRLSNGAVIDELLAQGKRIHGFWGTAPTGKPHIGYLVPLIKIAEMVAAGIDFSIYFADEYAYLINYKHPRELVDYRTQYYEFLVRATVEALGIPQMADHFVRESVLFAAVKQSGHDLNRLYTLLSIDDVRAVSNEMATTTMTSSLLCPARQSGVFALAERILPHLGYTSRAHLTTEMIPGLTTEKMSSSHAAGTKIELLDPPDVVCSKIGEATCMPGVVEGNALLAMARHILLPLCRLRMALEGGSHPFTVPSATGEDRTYFNYEDLEHDFLAHSLTPAELKASVAAGLNLVLDPIRNNFDSNEDWQKVAVLAYPE
ncbi:hypothetical protein ANOM_000982 [Aspergillus nomiae NRRL 13137]|uniref:tyrosine--tRNA ligase n=1 Tax=Aspergillus nomiae NRRL (strain ATCC 15546 / NRRL 13137 / CBS 260.88 / M93) TaxID=1509407 RepID=A0A0L1JGE8_ASPN3|nr:uncharacterized protein ANOM_000982 [Aspergillus nomiae NRRL 13137]KNG90836.1 hypothetical protein ANOM_000982 [Aspergillus nomiae NRRL 13137]